MKELENLLDQISQEFIKNINNLDSRLFEYFEKKLIIEKELNRKIVSFQANKNKPFYRWYKYKEAFSADLVQYLLNKQSIPKGLIFDPFAGAGTAIFASAEMGYDAEGIELLPIGQQICLARQLCLGGFHQELVHLLKEWHDTAPWNHCKKIKELNILRITEGAYSLDNKNKIERFLYAIEKEIEPVKNILQFSLLCILESISYTRKDGQYLRWDYRANRKNGGGKFNKGRIYSFDEAMKEKINQIIFDIKKRVNSVELFQNQIAKTGQVRFIHGSCLDNIPKIVNMRQ